MAYITKFGTLFGLAPVQTGRIHFVAPAASYTVDGRAYIASDDNDGLSPERAIRTLTQALTNVTASAGEVIYLLEGTHAQTATLRIQKAGVTLLGVRSSSEVANPGRSRAMGYKAIVSFVGAAAPGISVEADSVEIGFVELRPAPTFSTVIFRNANPDALYMHDFAIDFSYGQPSLATQGIDFGYRADVAGLLGTSMTRLTQTAQKATAYLADFSVISAGAYGPGILTATADVTVVNARFHTRAGVWATPFAVATGTGYIFVQASAWTLQGTILGVGCSIDGSNAGIVNGKVYLDECRFPPSTVVGSAAVDNFTAGVVVLTECYTANAAGGTIAASSA